MRGKLLWILAGTLIAAAVYATNAYFDPAKTHHTRDGFHNNYPHAERAGFWAWQWERWQKEVPRARGLVLHAGETRRSTPPDRVVRVAIDQR